ncbi:RnfABCDGE type electron transport complex subunit B [Rhodovulum adriaticum]|uniref:Ion-translocating oxidoreductase complex subunit B n=1 Tax=Rhodovulum adriaticum TaxID=35804 RepID=A0A4R2NKU7_RHOAD|nr:RnfABCDGE type electron transport complex subunit B [Rhodovulum adriaticum]MBK1635441.1 electron transporter RnfB [Rhodovulum adriaticum]TCP22012.1 electron transport complex protein RnfB [Rhodovulum adriaticum]
MLSAIASMTAMGAGLGLALGVAARKFHVETPPIVDEVEALLPGTNCGQCGYPGCRAGAEALADGSAPVTLCPPGGRDLALELADILGVDAGAGGDLDGIEEAEQLVAFIFEDHCTGCTKCFKRCPTDAIVGANRQIHTVITDACIGCDACIEVCPTEAIIHRPKPRTLRNWYWDRPTAEADGDTRLSA